MSPASFTGQVVAPGASAVARNVPASVPTPMSRDRMFGLLDSSYPLVGKTFLAVLFV